MIANTRMPACAALGLPKSRVAKNFPRLSPKFMGRTHPFRAEEGATIEHVESQKIEERREKS
jgi:hypothetical protein